MDIRYWKSTCQDAFFRNLLPMSQVAMRLLNLSHGAWSSLKDRPVSEFRLGRKTVMKSARIWNASIAGNSENIAAQRGDVGSSLSALPRPPLFASTTPLCSLPARANIHVREYQKAVRFARWIVSPRAALNWASLRVTQKESEFLPWFAIIADSKRECINILARRQPIQQLKFCSNFPKNSILALIIEWFIQTNNVSLEKFKIIYLFRHFLNKIIW